jgi:hypothetical protein
VSTGLAIAATTRVISSIIDDAIAEAKLNTILGSAATTATPPDHIVTGQEELTHLNLFLYQITYNSGWREVGLPSRNSNGDPIDRPPLGVDLHYLLSAYGAGDLESEILLGLGMQALHETPVLYREKIRKVFSPPPPLSAVDSALATANLADQIEMIKITPSQLTTEDLSKLWSAFGSKYRTSAAFGASVLLIESASPIRAALPVLARNVTVVAFAQPVVDGVEPQICPYSPALVLTLAGRNLAGEGTVVIFDGNPDAVQTPSVLDGSGAKIQVPVPALGAGINALRVVRQLAIGAPPPRNVVESNTAFFILQPLIRRDPNPPHADLIAVGPPNVTVTPAQTPITVQIDPAMTSAQRIALLLNQLTPPPGHAPLSFTFDARKADVAPNTVTFRVASVPPGNWLVRVRIDGAESPLRTDPTTSAFVAPRVTL